MDLFSMSSGDIDREVEKYNDRLLDRYLDDFAECQYCQYYNYGICQLVEDSVSDEEYEQMTKDEYISLVSRDPDDCCDGYKERRE